MSIKPKVDAKGELVQSTEQLNPNGCRAGRLLYTAKKLKSDLTWVVRVEVYSTQSGGTAVLASTNGPDSKSGLDTVGAQASGAMLSYGCSHSAANKCRQAAT